MKTYELNISDRKELVRRIEQLTGQKGKYSGVPRCAYLFEGCSVERDGTLTTEDWMDRAVLETLLNEGLVTGDLAEEEPEEEEAPEAPVQEVPEAPEMQENILKPEISFPTSQHTGGSLRNLVCLLHSKGDLISKATGGTFGAAEGLVEKLKADDACVKDYEAFARTVAEYEDANGPSISGVVFSPEKVSFTGFPEEGQPEKIRAFMDLAAAINQQAIRQNRVQNRPGEEPNEKYAMRIWLVRIGLDGPEYKMTRKMLMQNLSGHTAFRTKADEERWKVNQKARREAKKAQAAEPTGSDETESGVEEA